MCIRERERESCIDIIRGFAALSVIVGHLPSTPVALVYWIYSFHMPLFFICSGMVFSAGSCYKNFVIKKIRSLVVPYFCLGMTLWISKNLMMLFLGFIGDNPVQINWDFSHAITSLILAYRLNDHYLGIWFICTLFFGELFFYFIVRVPKQNILLPVISVVGIALQWFILKNTQGFYWSLDLVPVCLAFMSVGYLLRKNAKHLNALSQKFFLPIALTTSIAFTSLGCVSSGQVNLCMSHMGNPFWFSLAALSGSWLFIIISKHIGCVNPIIFFGRNSIVTYVFQTSLTIPLAQELSGFLARKFVLLSDRIFIWALEVLTVMVLSFIIIKAINLLFPWMLGRPYRRNSLRRKAHA